MITRRTFGLTVLVALPLATGAASAQVQVASMSSTDWMRLMDQYKQQQRERGRPTAVRGVVRGIDRRRAEITISHDAIPSVGMPAMAMSLPVADPSLIAQLHVGGPVEFDAENVAGVVKFTRITAVH